MSSLRFAVGIVVPTLLAAACSSSTINSEVAQSSSVPLVGSAESESAMPTSPSTESAVPLYVVDRILTGDIGSSLPQGILTGVTGTMAGGEVPEAFGERLLTEDPSLISFAYAGEAYDAVILAALSAAAAQSDQGAAIAGQASLLTTGTQECSDYAGCLSLLGEGGTIAYRGVSGATAFTADGVPTRGEVGIYQYGTDNRLDGAVEYRQATLQPSSAPSAGLTTAVQPGAGDGILTIGTLLDDDGALGFLSPAQRAGVRLAVADIVAAGGIPGFTDVRLADLSGVPVSSPGADPKSKGKEPTVPVDVVIGPTSAMAMRQALDGLAADGVLVISPTGVQAPAAAVPVASPTPSPTGLQDPSSTPAPPPATAAKRPATWVMTPPAVLQGAMLGSLPIADGHGDVAVLSNGDAYGEAMADAVASAVEQAGGRVVVRIAYSPGQKDFAQVVAQVRSAGPDAIVLTGGAESAKVIEELVRQGIGPNQIG